MTKILVTGATGTIGSRVAQSLQQQGAAVRVGVRNPAKAPELSTKGLEVVALDFDRPETVAAAKAAPILPAMSPPNSRAAPRS